MTITRKDVIDMADIALQKMFCLNSEKIKYSSKSFFSDVKNALKDNPKEIKFEVDKIDKFSFEIDRCSLPKEIRNKIIS